MLAPSQDAFIDPEHYSGVRHDPHQVRAEPTIQRPRTFLSNHEAERLDKSGIFFNPANCRLSKPRSKDLKYRKFRGMHEKVEGSVPREDTLSD